jgi:CRISPR system Cascade subunit CasA
MTYSFNLVDQPWIPCIAPDGRARELSLREALKQAHILRGITGDSPLETAALYRLLLAIVHSAFRGPESAADWNELWQAGAWDTPWLNAYLDKWQHRFDLFDPERPFYQGKDDRVRAKSIINVVMDMASGANATLFDHHTETIGAMLTCPQAARLVVAVQTFGLAGLCDPQQKLVFTDAPWARGIIFLVESDTLFQTLALNLLRYDDDHPLGFAATGNDCPAWESENPLEEREYPKGYLDYLTWQNRRILLIPEGDETQPGISVVSIAPGLRLNATLLDPFKNYRKDEQLGYLSTRFSEERALWRDSSALFNVKEQSEKHPPANFAWIARLADLGYIEVQRTLRFMALGMANNQAKVEFFRQEHMPLPLAFLEDSQLVGQLDSALLKAEETRGKLWSAVSWMSVLIVSPNSDGKSWKDINRITKEQAAQLYNHWSVEREYWGALELPFLRLLEGLPADPGTAMNEWEDTLKQTAWLVLEKAADQAGDSVHALKAAVRARGVLGHGLKELFPEPEKEVSA